MAWTVVVACNEALAVKNLSLISALLYTGRGVGPFGVGNILDNLRSF